MQIEIGGGGVVVFGGMKKSDDHVPKGLFCSQPKVMDLRTLMHN